MNEISKNTQVTLLLCSRLGGRIAGVSPLTDAQYNLVTMALCDLTKCPADLIARDGVDVALVGEVCARANDRNTTRVTPIEAGVVEKLLRRSFSLGSVFERWQNVGISVVGRGDAIFPKRLRAHLKPGEVPPLLYYSGNANLFAGGGMAFVGSRDMSEDAGKAICKVASQCVTAGMNIVSGGARGSDMTAMQTAYACGGRVIAALSGDLTRACLIPENRKALSEGRALLFSNAEPEVDFSSVNAVLRNKYIYAMADYAFVAQSDVKGGTWTGATEELRRETRHPVFVYKGNPLPEGNRQLLSKGAVAWQMDAPLEKNLEQRSLQQETFEL